MSEWYEAFKWPPPPRLQVARGLSLGQWSFVAYVPDRKTGEAVLERWRREHPEQVMALLRGGAVIEDAKAQSERLAFERREREAVYFARLAEEAQAEGRADRARYYRYCSERFREG
jgi:hypothetical protein